MLMNVLTSEILLPPLHYGLTAIADVIRRTSSAFNPVSFFSAGEQGVWYDPSDLSTLFQDSAGTTPVTAVEQPVGLMLDKSKGLVLGPELVTNGDFSNGITGWSVTAGVGGTITNISGELEMTTSGAGILVSSPISVVVGKTYSLSGAGRLGSYGPTVQFGVAATNNATPSQQTFTSTLQTVKTAIFTATATTMFVILRFPTVGTSGQNAFFDNISVRELPGNHAFQSTAIDRSILRQDEFGNYRLAANGTNTWMQTNSIDFSGTDKVTVFAGVRKLSDAARGIFCELGTGSLNGSFNLEAPFIGPLNTFGSNGRGTIAVGVNYIDPAPVTRVLAVRQDISGDALAIRSDSVQMAESTLDQGSGNFGNYPMFLFRRNGTSIPFNGYFYGLLIRGALCTDAQITSMEQWLAPKTGVTL